MIVFIKKMTVLSVMSLFPAVALAADSDLFESIDKNSDGTITREEFISCPLVRGKSSEGKERVKPRDLCANPLTDLTAEEKERLFKKLDVENRGSLKEKDVYKYATPDGFAPIRF